MLKTTDRIITLTDLQRHAAAVVDNAQTEPVAVTLRGRPVVYVVGVALFDELLDRLRERESAEVALAVRLSEQQFAAGDSVSLEEIEADLGLSGVAEAP